MISTLGECTPLVDLQKVQCDGAKKQGLCRQRVLGCNPLTSCVTLDMSLYLSGPQFPHLYRVGVAKHHIPSFPRGAINSNERVDGDASHQLGNAVCRE